MSENKKRKQLEEEINNTDTFEENKNYETIVTPVEQKESNGESNLNIIKREKKKTNAKDIFIKTWPIIVGGGIALAGLVTSYIMFKKSKNTNDDYILGKDEHYEPIKFVDASKIFDMTVKQGKEEVLNIKDIKGKDLNGLLTIYDTTSDATFTWPGVIEKVKDGSEEGTIEKLSQHKSKTLGKKVKEAAKAAVKVAKVIKDSENQAIKATEILNNPKEDLDKHVEDLIEKVENGALDNE